MYFARFELSSFFCSCVFFFLLLFPFSIQYNVIYEFFFICYKFEVECAQPAKINYDRGNALFEFDLLNEVKQKYTKITRMKTKKKTQSKEKENKTGKYEHDAMWFCEKFRKNDFSVHLIRIIIFFWRCKRHVVWYCWCLLWIGLFTSTQKTEKRSDCVMCFDKTEKPFNKSKRMNASCALYFVY